MFAGCRCPRCHDAVLQAQKREGCKVLACRRCGGAFVGASVGLRLVAVLEPDVPPATEEPRSPCPVCRASMRLVFATKAELTVDVCSRHGVWFDGNDLVPVLHAVAGALGKPVPKAAEAMQRHAQGAAARAEPPRASSPPSEPSPSWQPQPTGGGQRTVVIQRKRDALDTAVDVADIAFAPVRAAADVALLPFAAVGLLFEIID